MKIDIVPDLSPDFQSVGKATHFDFETTPGFVHVRFANGCEMKLLISIFQGARFYAGKEPIQLVGGTADKYPAGPDGMTRITVQ